MKYQVCIENIAINHILSYCHFGCISKLYLKKENKKKKRNIKRTNNKDTRRKKEKRKEKRNQFFTSQSRSSCKLNSIFQCYFDFLYSIIHFMKLSEMQIKLFLLLCYSFFFVFKCMIHVIH